MAAVRDLSTSDAVFKFVINNTLSDQWKARSVSTIMVVCLALEPIIKDHVEQLNKIGVAKTEPESARLFVNTVRDICTCCRSVFGISTCRFAEFDTSVIWHAVFILC